MTEITYLQSIAGPKRELQKGDWIRRQEDPVSSFDLLLEGWAASVAYSADGGRQMMDVNLPGDVLGVPGLALAEPFDGIIALSPIKLRSLPLASLRDIFENQPRIAASLFLISQEERVLMMERITQMSHNVAINRLAAFVLRLSERLSRLDPELRKEFDLPLTQHDLADLVGVTTVHMNGLVQSLRREKIIDLVRQKLTILDYEALRAMAKLEDWSSATPNWLPDNR